MTKRWFALLSVLIGLSTGCGDPNVAPRTDPILLIGVDGLEWDVLLPLLHSGKTPAMAALMSRGSYGLLNTFEPTLSPVIWTTIATGKQPLKHGIVDFTRPGAAGPAEELFNNTDRTTKAIWNIASDYEKRSAVVGWWMTYPVEAIRGVMVSQTNTGESFRKRNNMPWKGLLKRNVRGQVHPPQREAEILSVLPEIQASLDEKIGMTFGSFPYPLSDLEKQLWEKSSWAFRADYTYRIVANRLLDDPDPYDLFLVYFGGPDVYGHRFWRFRNPELFKLEMRPESVENFGSVIDDYYQYMDTAIGELVSKMGPGARVFIVSDHGMIPENTEVEDFEDAVPYSGHHWKAPPGVIIAAGPGIPDMPLHSENISELVRGDLQPLASVVDITPTLLTLMGIPAGKDMDGRAAEKLIDPDSLERFPLTARSTHDSDAWLEARGPASANSPNEEERLEQLRSLGYLE